MCEIAEDGVVEYWVYPDGYDSLTPHQALTLKTQYEEFIAKLVPQTFLWNGAPFALKCTEGAPGILHGKQFFGDDMQDEWFVVHLLFSLSRAHPNLTIRITDSDGEFLLIESYDHLPDWLTPETSTNRVFVRNGSLCILSIPQSPADLGVLPLECPATPEAGLAALLRASPASTAAPPAVQEAIAARLAGFPGALGERRQRARAILPRAAAHALRRFPGLAPHAANAFRGQDPDERIERVGEEDSELGRGGSVELLVELTRFTYAELMYTEQREDENEIGRDGPLMFEMSLGRMLTAGLECIWRKGKRMGEKSEKKSEDEMICKDCVDIERALEEMRRGDVPRFARVDLRDVDSDDWMDVDPDEFDELLKSKTKKDLIDDVNKFMMGSSEFDGVKGGFDSDDDDDDESEEEDDYEEGDDGELNFDPDKMLGLIRSALMGNNDGNEGVDEEERRFQEELEREIKNSTLGEMYGDGGDGNDEESDDVAAQCLLKSLAEPGNPLSSLLYMNSHKHTQK